MIRGRMAAPVSSTTLETDWLLPLTTNMAGKPQSSSSKVPFSFLVTALVLFSLGGGYFAGLQPINQWRFFSWHPLLMTCGMVGCFGVGAVTKKLGGYTNTKLHGIIAWAGIFLSLAGLYVIYRNKELNGYGHLKSTHALAGLGVFVVSIGLGLVGGIVLHPDFGIDKQNKLIRSAHKTASRVAMFAAWMVALSGLYQLSPNNMWILALYAVPLLCFVPWVLL